MSIAALQSASHATTLITIMDYMEQVATNKRIMALIASKYPEPGWTIDRTLEARYFLKLQDDVITAEHWNPNAPPPDPAICQE